MGTVREMTCKLDYARLPDLSGVFKRTENVDVCYELIDLAGS